MYSTLLSTYNYGGLELKNRIIFAPTTMGLKQNEYFQFIEKMAAGGCAMIIIGDVPVGKSQFGHSLYSKKGFAFYKKISDIVHKYDCKLCAQLHQNDTTMKGMWKFIPKMLTGKVSKQDVKNAMTEKTGDYISSIPTADVKAITSSFGDAAKKAVEAGFDIVQVHGDRMCGSFSSSLFNHRTDEYGGSVENRARFAIESIQAIRESVPELPIDYKLCVRQENPHYGNAGVLFEELEEFVPLLEKAGVTSFHITLANHSRLEDPIPPRTHPYFKDEGCFLPYCKEVRKYTQLPICAVGTFSHPDFVEDTLNTKDIQCVAMSRQLIADPLWVYKVESHKENEIQLCCRCNKKCLNGMYEHKGVHCIYEGGNVK